MVNKGVKLFLKNFAVGGVFIIFLSIIFAIAGAIGIVGVANLGDIGTGIAEGDVGIILFAAFTLFAIGIMALIVFALSSKIGGIFGLKESSTHMPKKIKIVSVIILGLLIVVILGALENFLTGLDENYGGFTIQGIILAFEAGDFIAFFGNVVIIAIVGTIVLGAAAYFGKISSKGQSKGIPGT